METTTQNNPVLSYTAKPNARPPRRFNGRLIVFLMFAAAPFLFFIALYANSQVHRGIEHAGSYDKVDLKALGYFPFDQNIGTIDEVPHKWRDLDGKRIQLEGFMFAGQSAAGQLSDFQLVYNVQKCCFSGPPQVQERVFAHVPRGRTVPYYGDFCRVTGTLHVKLQKDKDGVIISLYTLDVESADLIS